MDKSKNFTAMTTISNPKLIEQFPHLVPRDLFPKATSAALAAKNLRRELKQHFPKHKFRIKSQNYSGGSSINASLVLYESDGYTAENARRLEREADALTKKYEYGSFDGMTDSYDYKDDPLSRDFCDTFGGASYVFVTVRVEPFPTKIKEIRKSLKERAKENNVARAKTNPVKM